MITIRLVLLLVRLSLGLVSIVCASLAIFRAPTKTLWKLAIGATEWGHLLAIVALVPLFPGRRRTWVGRFGAILGGISAFILLTPLLRAFLVARRLPRAISVAFGEANAQTTGENTLRSAPLKPLHLLWGVPFSRGTCESRTYVIRNDTTLSLDVYPPLDAQHKAPCVVVIHGGSWHHGTSKDLAPLNHYLAAHGYFVASVNYRLAPHHPFPAARDDVQTAIRYLRANSEELGLDPQRIILIGRSSGAHLALLVAYTADDPSILGVVSFYGPPDLRYSYEHPSKYPAVFDTRRVLTTFMGGSLEQIPAVYDEASPINYVGRRTPPTLLIHGGRDEFVDLQEIERLAQRLERVAVPYFLLCLPWATHGGDFNFSGPSGQISTYAIERFLAAVVQNSMSNEQGVAG